MLRELGKDLQLIDNERLSNYPDYFYMDEVEHWYTKNDQEVPYESNRYGNGALFPSVAHERGEIYLTRTKMNTLWSLRISNLQLLSHRRFVLNHHHFLLLSVSF